MAWDPAQYLRFETHRLRPVIDLIGRIGAEAPAIVVDLGCGSGNATRLLAGRWPNAKLIGVDGSREMLAKAESEASGINWTQADLADWRPERPADVLFSNAALHWLGRHERLFPRLMDTVAPGGVLAVQMPRNFTAPSHVCIRETIEAGPWAARLGPMWQDDPVEAPGYYYDLLAPLAGHLDIWETIYSHVLEGENPVAEWTKGSWLKQFLEALDEPERSQFEDDYRQRVRAAYPPAADGRTLLPFRRLFILAQKYDR